MQEIFSFKRFWLLIVKYWQEQRRVLLMLAVVSMVIVIVFETLSMAPTFSPLSENTQRSIFVIGLSILLPIYSFSFFGFINKKEQATSYFLVPTSSFEKLITNILYATILITILWILVFFSVNEIMVKILNYIAIQNRVRYADMFYEGRFLPRNAASLKSIITQDSSIIFLAYIFQAFALLGAVMYPKYTVVKTITVVFLLFIFTVFVLQSLVLPILFNSKFQFDGFDKFKSIYFRGRVYTNHSYLEKGKYILIPSPLKEIAAWGYYYGIWIFLTIITFFKLKEKQV